MNSSEYESGPTTIYFEREDDAEMAQEALQRLGISAGDMSLESQHTSGGFIESLKNFFAGEPADGYADGALLVIRDTGRGPQVYDVARRYNGRLQDAPASPRTEKAAYTRDEGTKDEQTMRLREERLTVDKQAVQEGEVRLRKEVVTDNQRIDVPVRHEEVYLERRGTTPQATDAGEIDEEGEEEEIRIPVMHEEVHVEKHPVATEEVAIGKRVVQETQSVGAGLRKERAWVETEGSVTPKGVIETD